MVFLDVEYGQNRYDQSKGIMRTSIYSCGISLLYKLGRGGLIYQFDQDKNELIHQ